MTAIKNFQQATVDAVVAAFKANRRCPRFLVADEVGLGKTVVAQHVMRRMMQGRRKPLVVFYMCSNLTIARQNRRKLLEILPPTERATADCTVDRLSLLLAGQRPTHPNLRLYSLTPDTSIPIRKGQRRDGRQEERALLLALVRRLWPKLLRHWPPRRVFQRRASVWWPTFVKHQKRKTRRSSLRAAFNRAVREEFELASGANLVSALLSPDKVGELDDLQLIARFRNALAAAAIDELQPDLVVFDEFQRYRDLFEPTKDATARRVIDRLLGNDVARPPALLFLSATPYRVFTRRTEEDSGPSHHDEFFSLIEFLYGGDAKAKQVREQCEAAFANLEGELRKGLPDSEVAATAKRTIEGLLTPVIARTERASHPQVFEQLDTELQKADIAAPDLAVFKHLVRSLHARHRGSAVPYWSSIPMPMQTMGADYIVWKSGGQAPRERTPHLSRAMRDRYRKPKTWPHPKLRALHQMASAEQLALPWLAPTAPWWPLRNAWEDSARLPRKLLVFSRFRAVPQAIASAISYDFETRWLKGESKDYADVGKRRLLTATKTRHALLALFHPSPFLIRNTDPLAAGSSDLRRVRREVRRQLKKALTELDVSVNANAKALPPWRLIARLEKLAEDWDMVIDEWYSLQGEVSITDAEDSGFAQLLSDWNQEAVQPLEEIRPSDLDMLAEIALGAPGVVLGRALARHWRNADDEDADGTIRFQRSLDASWLGLRNYLDQRWFYRALARTSESYPDAILRISVDGNLEAVLDEHLWITSQLRNVDGPELAAELRDSLSLRVGNAFMHPLEGNRRETFSIRCHVATPFVESRIRTLEGGEKPVRTDDLRRAFNSPFWPYVLATTSVGQEGLDFHVWCDSLVHWDLCRNPVDLEQREGRIQRYGGLSVRRAVAARPDLAAKLKREGGVSPWSSLGRLAETELADESGLSPWWVCQGGSIRRCVLDVPTSDQRLWLEWMKNQRLLYRLALGQPNQEDLLELLSEKLQADVATVRKSAIDLSPWFRHSTD